MKSKRNDPQVIILSISSHENIEQSLSPPKRMNKYEDFQTQREWYENNMIMRQVNINFLMDQSRKVDPSDLVIIITTSPVPSNPATDIIDMAIGSIKKQPSLEGVSIIIVCDGCKVTEQNVSKYKSGIVSKESLQNYSKFKFNLKEKYQGDPSISIIERTARHCFAQNIKHVMLNVEQPFVMIFQHDHMFLRTMDIFTVVETMKNHPLNYIGFMNKSVSKLPFTLDQDPNLRKYFSALINYQTTTPKHDHESFVTQVVDYYKHLYGIPLIPLIFWYDKVHIARRSFYLEVIFNKKGFYDEIKKTYFKTISFVEDSFGTSVMKNIRNRPSKFQELNSFILWDNPQQSIIHIHGRCFWTKGQKQELFLSKINEKDSSSSSSSLPEEFQELSIDLFNQK